MIEYWQNFIQCTNSPVSPILIVVVGGLAYIGLVQIAERVMRFIGIVRP